jgi:hypothetical protein
MRELLDVGTLRVPEVVDELSSTRIEDKLVLSKSVIQTIKSFSRSYKAHQTIKYCSQIEAPSPLLPGPTSNQVWLP